jgi:hypothetical protein
MNTPKNIKKHRDEQVDAGFFAKNSIPHLAPSDRVPPFVFIPARAFPVFG